MVAVSPQMRLVEDNPSSISLLDIYKNRCQKQGLDHDNPIARYYEKLANVQARGGQASQQVLREILKEVQNGHHGQNSMVPKTMLKDWATQSFVTATDYWTFRKMFTLQLALAAFAEYVLHLSRLNPDMMYIHQDSGLINISYFKLVKFSEGSRVYIFETRVSKVPWPISRFEILTEKWVKRNLS